MSIPKELKSAYLDGIKGKAMLTAEKGKADQFWDDQELVTALRDLNRDVSDLIQMLERK